ncbi:hypothetical protein ILUMI_19069 [Ignelater luminosus]|uniref:Uncharacterized protein n=1 Tax=Ignelater luminosus TaxID=2038154 RepID=A0A8K0CIT1_IGNLU|nr:hypothetical protein ILUMI_19069 [Ignelater luminosus]
MFQYGLILFVIFVCVFGRPDYELFHDDGVRPDRHMHRIQKRDLNEATKRYDPQEETANYWVTKAQFTLTEQLAKQPKLG